LEPQATRWLYPGKSATINPVEGARIL